MEYISSDNIAVLQCEATIRDMGKQTYVSSVLLDGPPGTGKTYLAKYLAWKLKAKLLQFQFYPGCGREDLILDLAIGENGKRTWGILLTALDMSQKGPVVLLLDELDKAEARVDSFLLTILNDGYINVPQIGEFYANTANLLIVITKNDEREASGPLLRRCRCIQMQWPTVEVETKMLKQAHPFLSDEACLALIDTANRLRSHPDTKKPPSFPELVRAAGDLMHLVKQDANALDLGKYYINAIAPVVRDRLLIPDSPSYLGTNIKTNFLKCAPDNIDLGKNENDLTRGLKRSTGAEEKAS